MPFDQTIEGNVRNFLEFNKNRFSRLYLCKTCVRSFETDEATTHCKFCASAPLAELLPSSYNPVQHRYCTGCHAFFPTQEAHCPRCAQKPLSLFRFSPLRKRQRIRIFLRRGIYRVREKLPTYTVRIPALEDKK